RGRCALSRQGGHACGRYDDIDIGIPQLGGELRKVSIALFGRARFDHDVAALDVAEIAETLPKSLDQGIGKRERGEIADLPDLPRLLRLHSERRKREAKRENEPD